MNKPLNQYDTGLGTTDCMWGLLSDIIIGHRLPESLNEAIYRLVDGEAFIVLKEDINDD